MSDRDEPALVSDDDLRAIERLSLEALHAILSGIGGDREGLGSSVGFEFADYRRYTPGDDVRRIDWTVYARLRELYVRTAPQEARLSLALLVDASASMDYGDPNKLYHARRLAALLGAVALLASETAQVHTLFDGEAITGGLHDATNQLGPWLSELQRLPTGRTTNLASSVRRARDQAASSEVAILISDALTPPDELRRALRELTHDALAAALLHVTDPTEAEAGPRGPVALIDRETGQRIELDVTDQAQERYAVHYAQMQAEIEQACREAGVRYVAASTSVDALELLVDSARSELLLRPRTA
jgi:uncharacterized protein (DUF58 family)